MAKQHALQTIYETGSTPVTKVDVKVQSMIPEWQARGASAARAVIAECKAHGGTWKLHLNNLCTLEKEGRAEFRKILRAEYKIPKGVEYDEVAKASQRSARTRMAEFEAIARALDAGMELEPDTAFYFALGQSRTFLRAKAMGSTRGRKATPDIEKMAKYIAVNAPKVGGLDAVLDLVKTMKDETETEEK